MPVEKRGISVDNLRIWRSTSTPLRASLAYHLLTCLKAEKHWHWFLPPHGRHSTRGRLPLEGSKPRWCRLTTATGGLMTVECCPGAPSILRCNLTSALSGSLDATALEPALELALTGTRMASRPVISD